MVTNCFRSGVGNPLLRVKRSRTHFPSTLLGGGHGHGTCGVGPKCYAQFYNAFDSSGGQWGVSRSVHSSHFQMLAEVGFIGFFVWLLLFCLSLIHLWRVRSLSKHPSLSATEALFLETSASCIACSIVVFGSGAAFYEFAHMELIWMSFVLTAVLVRMSREMIGSAATRVANTDSSSTRQGRQSTNIYLRARRAVEDDNKK
jgi:O-antigen ligase